MELSEGDMVETKGWTPAGLVEGDGKGPHYLFHLDRGVILLVTAVNKVKKEDRIRTCICYDAASGNRYNISDGFLRRIDTHVMED